MARTRGSRAAATACTSRRPWITDRPPLAGHRRIARVVGRQPVRQPAAGRDEHPPAAARRPDRGAHRRPEPHAAVHRGQRRRGGVDHQRHEWHVRAEHVVGLHHAVVDGERVGQREVEAVGREPVPDRPGQVAGDRQRPRAGAEVAERHRLLHAEHERRHDVVEVGVEVVGPDDDDGVRRQPGDGLRDPLDVGDEPRRPDRQARRAGSSSRTASATSRRTRRPHSSLSLADARSALRAALCAV